LPSTFQSRVQFSASSPTFWANLRAVQFVVAGFAALRGRSKARHRRTASSVNLAVRIPGFTGSAEDKDAAISMPSGNDAIAESQPKLPPSPEASFMRYAAVLKPSGSDAVMEPGTIAEPATDDQAKPETSESVREGKIDSPALG